MRGLLTIGLLLASTSSGLTQGEPVCPNPEVKIETEPCGQDGVITFVRLRAPSSGVYRRVQEEMLNVRLSPGHQTGRTVEEYETPPASSSGSASSGKRDDDGNRRFGAPWAMFRLLVQAFAVRVAVLGAMFSHPTSQSNSGSL